MVILNGDAYLDVEYSLLSLLLDYKEKATIQCSGLYSKVSVLDYYYCWGYTWIHLVVCMSNGRLY